MNLLGSFNTFVAICDDAGIIISLLLNYTMPRLSNIEPLNYPMYNAFITNIQYIYNPSILRPAKMIST